MKKLVLKNIFLQILKKVLLIENYHKNRALKHLRHIRVNGVQKMRIRSRRRKMKRRRLRLSGCERSLVTTSCANLTCAVILAATTTTTATSDDQQMAPWHCALSSSYSSHCCNILAGPQGNFGNVAASFPYMAYATKCYQEVSQDWEKYQSIYYQHHNKNFLKEQG